MPAYAARHYRAPDGTDVFGAWFDTLRDQQAQQRVAARVDRLALGLFGDAKPVREGVRESRIDWGPGYRVYDAVARRAMVLLLCGGNRRTQRADIVRAVGYWTDFQGRRR